MNYVWLSSDFWDFAGSSFGKESTCNAGDPGSVPGLGRSPREGICYPLQYSWAFPGGSDGKEFSCNVGDLGSIPGFEDPLEKGKAAHSSILAWRTPWTDSLVATVCAAAEPDSTEQLSAAQHRRSVGFPGGARGGEPARQGGNWRSSPWAGKIPRRRTRQPTPIRLPRESHGQGSLAGYSP